MREDPRRCASWTAALGCALVALCLPACSPAGPVETGRAHGVLLIAIDGLRADHVRHLGYDRDTTPTIDRLASEGVSLSQVFAASPALLPSHASVLTGCDPNVARRVFLREFSAPRERRWWIPDEVPRLAVEFLAHGYATGAFVDHTDVSPVYGFAPGFQEFVQFGDQWPRRQGESSRRFLQWLRSLRRSQPWFAYVHFNDLEFAWAWRRSACENFFENRPRLNIVPPVGSVDPVFFAVPPSRWRGGSTSLARYEAIYDGHLRCLDQTLNALLGTLEVEGRLADTTVVVLGTHGIQFGEAGLYLCSGRYSTADLNVPLVVRPGRSIELAPGRRGAILDPLVSLVDVAPTLLDLCGLPVPSGTHGVSQRALFVEDEPLAEVRRRFAFASCGLQEGCAVIGERYCLEVLVPERVRDPQLKRSWFGSDEDPLGVSRRFYDRLANPHPRLDWVGAKADAEELREFNAAATQWIQNITLTRRYLQAKTLRLGEGEDEMVGRLRGLGYLGSEP